MQMPPNVRPDRVKKTATLTNRAGMLIRLQGAAACERWMAGLDGETYLGTLSLKNVLNVQTPGCACRVSVDYPKNGMSIAQISPLQYLKEAAP